VPYALKLVLGLLLGGGIGVGVSYLARCTGST